MVDANRYKSFLIFLFLSFELNRRESNQIFLINMYNTMFDSYIKEKNSDQNLTVGEKDKNF
jgi:hypothetical protein